MAPLFEALEQGRGVVAALPHSGNWDLAGLWFVETQRRLGRPARFTTVVERLRPESLFRRFVAYREGLGFEVLAAGDGPVVYRTLTERLRDGRAGLPGRGPRPQRLRARGVVLRRARAAAVGAGPARRARPARCSSRRSRRSPRTAGPRAIGDPIPVPVPNGGRARHVATATQALADALAALIATAPHDWHMLQRVWTADLRGGR